MADSDHVPVMSGPRRIELSERARDELERRKAFHYGSLFVFPIIAIVIGLFVPPLPLEKKNAPPPQSDKQADADLGRESAFAIGAIGLQVAGVLLAYMTKCVNNILTRDNLISTAACDDQQIAWICDYYNMWMLTNGMLAILIIVLIFLAKLWIWEISPASIALAAITLIVYSQNGVAVHQDIVRITKAKSSGRHVGSRAKTGGLDGDGADDQPATGSTPERPNKPA